MPAYLIGKVISVFGGLLADLVIFLVPAVLLIEGLRIGPDSWPRLAWRNRRCQVVCSCFLG
jgi:ABC-2 type transport system permease protein